MILITFAGLDPFVTGRYSREHLRNLASLFETDEEEVSFFAPNGTIVHDGVEQTSWNVRVTVEAPRRLMAVEEVVSSYLLRTIQGFAINIEVLFRYFDEEHLHRHLSEDYPRYIGRDEIREAEEESGEEPEPWLGDAFAERREELEELERRLGEKAAHDDDKE